MSSSNCIALPLLLIAVVATLLGTAARAQEFPFGIQHQSYRPGTLMPSGFTRTELNQHVANYYDFWKNRWVKPDPGGDGWRVLQNSAGDTVSEGQGYGMVIVAAMAGHDPQAKAIFDGLWQFRAAHPSEIDDRLMDWKVPLATGNDSAFDGDADIAYGLLMAHAQWGSGGAINYLAEAQNVIAGIRQSTIGPDSMLPMLGDWVTPGSATSTATYSQWTTRSSDFMPGHFRAFGAATGDKAYWSSVTTAVQNVITNIQANESATTGLLPDFIRHAAGTPRDPQPAPAGFLEGPQDGQYWYNAGRDPWRLGVDAILNNDPTTLAQVQKLSQWMRTSTGGVAANVGGGYQLNGTPLNTWEDHFFIAPLTVAAMTGSTPADQAWLDALYQFVYQRHNTGDYYADAVTLLSLLAVTGNFWDPMAVLDSAPLPGDYNHDDEVDADDYAAWKTAYGTTGPHAADGNGDLVVDAIDYTIWRNALLSGTGSGGLSAAIPEPTVAVLAITLLAMFSTLRVRCQPGR